MVAVDLYGYGDTPMWPGTGAFSLDREAELLDDIFSESREPIFVVGHSYGGAVGLTAALRHPQIIAGIIVYEPVLFGLLDQRGETAQAAREIASLDSEITTQLARGKPAEAARAFVDYWSGAGSFASYADKLRDQLALKMNKVALDFQAIFNSRTPLSDYRKITAPTVLLYGLASPAPTRIITDLLARTIAAAEVRGLLGLGHMGMASGKETINRVAAKFLDHIRLSRDHRASIPSLPAN